MRKYLIRWWSRFTRSVIEHELREYLTPERFRIPQEWEDELRTKMRLLKPHHIPMLEALAHRLAHRALDDLFGKHDSKTP